MPSHTVELSYTGTPMLDFIFAAFSIGLEINCSRSFTVKDYEDQMLSTIIQKGDRRLFKILLFTSMVT